MCRRRMALELKPGVTLYFSRHGQTEANVVDLFCGKQHSPLTEKGRAVLARARKLIETRHEIRLRELLGDDNRELLLAMLGKIAREF